MKTFNRLSIKLKLFITCISTVILSILLFAAVIYIHSSKVVTHLAERNVEQSINSASSYVENIINDIYSRLLSFQANEDVQEIFSEDIHKNPADDVERLEKILSGLDIFHVRITKATLYIMGKNDFPSSLSSKYVFSDKALENDFWYNTAVSSGNTASWHLYDSIYSNRSVITASKVIYSVAEKKPAAVLKADISSSVFADYLDSITLAKTGKVFLCSDTHILNVSKSELGSRLANNPVIFDDMLTKNYSQTCNVKINNEKWLIRTTPLAATKMYLLGAVKINEFSSAQSSITMAILVTSAALILLSFLFIFVTSTIITKPILRLSSFMRSYSIEKDEKIDTVFEDEIGTLYNSFNLMNDTIHTLITNIKNETKIRKLAELKALQAQITPHFLYNTLNSISALSKHHGAHDIEEMTDALAQFFMHSLNNGAEIISIENELEHVLSYVYIQKIRYSDKFDIEINADSDVKQYGICKLTLQPLVENCIYHGFECIDKNGHIIINAAHRDGKIIITVSDNGCGNITVDFESINEYVKKDFDFNEPIEKYGIHNISQRLRLYFGNTSSIVYYPNEDEGITVCITIPAVLPGDGGIEN